MNGGAAAMRRPVQARRGPGQAPMRGRGVAYMPALIFVTSLVLILGHTAPLQYSGTFGAVRWVLLAIYCVLLVTRAAVRHGLRKARAADAVIALFLALAVSSTLYSIAPSLTWQRGASAILLYVAVFWTLWDYADAAGEAALLRPIVTAAVVMLLASVALIALPGISFQRDGRFRGALSNPNALGLITAILFPLVLTTALRHRRAVTVGVLGTFGLCLLLSGSRTGAVACVASSLYILLRQRSWKGALMVVWIATLGYLFLSIEPGSNPFSDHAVSRLDPTAGLGTGSGRLEAWSVGWPRILESAALGHGFGTEDLIFAAEGGHLKESLGLHLHNSYLGMMYQLGFVGTLLFFLPLIWLAGQQMWWMVTRPVPGATLPYEAVLISGLICCLFESWIYAAGNAFAFPFWICVMLRIRGASPGSAAAAPARPARQAARGQPRPGERPGRWAARPPELLLRATGTPPEQAAYGAAPGDDGERG